MGFDFELTISGLVLFSVPDGTPSQVRVHLVHSAMSGHRPLLTYFTNQVEDPINTILEDDFYSDPRGRPIAHRALDKELLTLEPEWTGSPDRLTLDKTVTALGNLSQIEPERIVQPKGEVRDTGLLPVLKKATPSGSPEIARMIFKHGTLSAKVGNAKYKFIHRKGNPPQRRTAAPKKLAQSVTLKIKGLNKMTIKSNKHDPLVFALNTGGTVQVALSNDPEKDFKPDLSFIDHFQHLYDLVSWENGSSAPTNARVPHLDVSITVGDRFCPPSIYALPK